MADSVDVNKLRARKRRLKKIRKLLWFLIIVAVVLSLYLNRDIWMHKIEGIGSRYSTIKQNEGKLAKGNFPLTIQGSEEFKISSASGRLYILSEDTLYEYTTGGELDKVWKHNLSNAVMETSGGRVLVYEEGSTKLKVFSKNSTVYTNEVTDSILFGRINKDGYCAIITESDTYDCKLYVFDPDGNNIYERDCLERIMDVNFKSDNSGCYMSTLESSDGDIKTSIICADFRSVDDQWQTEPADSLNLNIFSDSKDNIYMVCDTFCNIYNKSGALVQTYTYQAELADYSYSDGNLALLLNDESRHKIKLVVFSDPEKSPYENYFQNNIKSVYASGSGIYIMSSDGIDEYKTDGTKISSASLDDAYNDFIRIDNYAFLIGYDRIERIDFKD